MTVPGRTSTIDVTGAASGIGAATARRLIADGYRGIAVDLRRSFRIEIMTTGARAAGVGRVGARVAGVRWPTAGRWPTRSG